MLEKFADSHGEINMIMVFDSSDKIKKVLERSKWQLRLRLVNEDMVNTSSLYSSGTNTSSNTNTRVTSFRRRCPKKEQCCN